MKFTVFTFRIDISRKYHIKFKRKIIFAANVSFEAGIESRIPGLIHTRAIDHETKDLSLFLSYPILWNVLISKQRTGIYT